MEKLEVLDLEGNKVDDLGALVYLGWCPQLAILNLADNPVAQEPNYTAQVLLSCILWLLVSTTLRISGSQAVCLQMKQHACC